MKEQQPLALPGSAPNAKGDVAWNYEKFVIDRRGQTVLRYKSVYPPGGFEDNVRLLLKGKPPLPAECVLHAGRKVCNVEEQLAA
mmetsp:Transcript_19091/g.32748  ORF Transcript_19091/g.32748 Transcript_19091/m.32748 type:complete len:84 (+) Transcript_19091:544-795(+)